MITVTSLNHPAFKMRVIDAVKRAKESFNLDPVNGGYAEAHNRKGIASVFVIFDGKRLEACDSKGNDITGAVTGAIEG